MVGFGEDRLDGFLKLLGEPYQGFAGHFFFGAELLIKRTLAYADVSRELVDTHPPKTLLQKPSFGVVQDSCL